MLRDLAHGARRRPVTVLQLTNFPSLPKKKYSVSYLHGDVATRVHPDWRIRLNYLSEAGQCKYFTRQRSIWFKPDVMLSQDNTSRLTVAIRALQRIFGTIRCHSRT